MTSLTMGHLPSLRKQHLLSEFAGLKQACPEGVFVSLTPGEPALWSAVLFVRDGPYTPAVMRFQIAFPDAYPRLPPVVTFSTDMFHPLITPSTTYMYTTDMQDDGSVSATDQERLPPGGFSLRHGFPEWFVRGRRNITESRNSSGDQATNSPSQRTSSTAETPESVLRELPAYMQTNKRPVSVYSILKYIRSTFDNEEVLDSIPLSAAGNPGAWHAWRTHRRKAGKGSEGPSETPKAPALSEDTQVTPVGSPTKSLTSPRGSVTSPKKEMTSPRKGPLSPNKTTPQGAARRPAEWNWDGVWGDRVKKGINASLSEPVLFGPAGGPDDLIRFLAMEETDVESVKDNLLRTLGGV